MAYPVYEGNGGIAAAGDYSVDVPYPSGISAGDILIVQLLDADNDSFNTPTDWALIYQEGANSNASHAYFWKRATGSESGTETFTSVLNAGAGVYGVMSRFSGCASAGTPYENISGVAVSQTSTPTIPALTIGGIDRLAVGFVTVEDNISLTGLTDFTQAYQLESTFGGDANLGCFYQEVSSNTAADELALATGEYTGVLGFALLPWVSGNNLTKDLSDSITLSDNDAPELAINKNIADSVTLSDSDSYESAINKSIADSVTLSDGQTTEAALERRIDDSVTLSDNETTELAINKAIDDSVTLSDDDSDKVLAQALEKTLADAITLSDDDSNKILAQALTKEIDDTVTLSDSDIRETGLNKSIDDVVVLSDNETTEAAYNRGVDDTVTLSDNDTVERLIEINIDDSITLSDNDTEELSQTLVKDIDDEITLSDNQIHEAELNKNIDDAITLSDGQTYEVDLNLTLNDSITLSDNESTEKSMDIEINDSITLSENLSVSNNLELQIDDVIELSDFPKLENNNNMATKIIALAVRIGQEMKSIWAALAGKAPLNSPNLTGIPTAPTAAEDDDSTLIATTAFVQTEIANFSAGDMNVDGGTWDSVYLPEQNIDGGTL